MELKIVVVFLLFVYIHTCKNFKKKKIGGQAEPGEGETRLIIMHLPYLRCALFSQGGLLSFYRYRRLLLVFFFCARTDRVGARPKCNLNPLPTSPSFAPPHPPRSGVGGDGVLTVSRSPLTSGRIISGHNLSPGLGQAKGKKKSPRERKMPRGVCTETQKKKKKKSTTPNKKSIGRARARTSLPSRAASLSPFFAAASFVSLAVPCLLSSRNPHPSRFPARAHVHNRKASAGGDD